MLTSFVDEQSGSDVGTHIPLIIPIKVGEWIYFESEAWKCVDISHHYRNGVYNQHVWVISEEYATSLLK